ncbi:hypothetical protein SDC9_107217 [bioreactor metagenome]|uniref:Uncharacterized protein n=1 Tax=bioreactor metagenome TaxID=1076179 RepID=A0A645B5N5_9ZZZZ
MEPVAFVEKNATRQTAGQPSRRVGGRRPGLNIDDHIISENQPSRNPHSLRKPTPGGLIARSLVEQQQHPRNGDQLPAGAGGFDRSDAQQRPPSIHKTPIAHQFQIGTVDQQQTDEQHGDAAQEDMPHRLQPPVPVFFIFPKRQRNRNPDHQQEHRKHIVDIGHSRKSIGILEIIMHHIPRNVEKFEIREDHDQDNPSAHHVQRLHPGQSQCRFCRHLSASFLPMPKCPSPILRPM